MIPTNYLDITAYTKYNMYMSACVCASVRGARGAEKQGVEKIEVINLKKNSHRWSDGNSREKSIAL